MKSPPERERAWRLWQPVAATADFGVIPPAQPGGGAETVRCLTERLADPFWWPEASTVEVDCEPDLFGATVPDSFLGRAFWVMSATGWHTFLVRTREVDRLAAFVAATRWPPNVWVGPPDKAGGSPWRQPGGRMCEGLPPLPPFRVPSAQERGWAATGFVPEVECPYPLDLGLLSRELEAMGDDPDYL